MDKIAIVTLIRSSGDETERPEELIKAIRASIQSSPIGKLWAIEKITMLEEAGPVLAEMPSTVSKAS